MVRRSLEDTLCDFDRFGRRHESRDQVSHQIQSLGWEEREKLDAESVNWFKENGGLTRKNGDWFRNKLLSRGGSVDALQLFRDFRGRDATVEPLLERRGLNAK